MKIKIIFSLFLIIMQLQVFPISTERAINYWSTETYKNINSMLIYIFLSTTDVNKKSENLLLMIRHFIVECAKLEERIDEDLSLQPHTIMAKYLDPEIAHCVTSLVGPIDKIELSIHSYLLYPTDSSCNEIIPVCDQLIVNNDDTIDLDLTGLSLTSLEGIENIKNVDKVELLILYNNRFKNLNPERLKVLTNLKEIRLENNQDFKINQELQEYLTNKKIQLYQ